MKLLDLKETYCPLAWMIPILAILWGKDNTKQGPEIHRLAVFLNGNNSQQKTKI
jgi:hypothetical protein